MPDFRAPTPIAPDSVTFGGLAPELRDTIFNLQIENLRLKYLLREVDGKYVANQLIGMMPQLEVADLIGQWETNREKMIGEIVAHVVKSLFIPKP